MIEKRSHVVGENSVTIDDVLNDKSKPIERLHGWIIEQGNDFGKNVLVSPAKFVDSSSKSLRV